MEEADWTPEPPEREASPLPPEERIYQDNATDAEALRPVREGGATAEETALIEQYAADMDAVNREEEAMLSALGCVVGAAS